MHFPRDVANMQSLTSAKLDQPAMVTTQVAPYLLTDKEYVANLDRPLELSPVATFTPGDTRAPTPSSIHKLTYLYVCLTSRATNLSTNTRTTSPAHNL